MTRRNLVQPTQFVGGYLPKVLADRLALLAARKDKSRSKLLRQILEKSELGELSTEGLIDSIASRAIKDYEQLTIDVGFEEFKIFLTEKLKRKKIVQEHIDSIVEQMEKLNVSKKE